MTEKKLRKLSRRELLEMLVVQTRKVESLEKQLEEANQKLQDKMIQIENSGSLAEAVMRLNGVFEAAENAARQYLENIHSRNPKPEKGEEKDGNQEADP